MIYIKYNKIKYTSEEKKDRKNETKDKPIAYDSFNIISSTCYRWDTNLTLRFLGVN